MEKVVAELIYDKSYCEWSIAKVQIIFFFWSTNIYMRTPTQITLPRSRGVITISVNSCKLFLQTSNRNKLVHSSKNVLLRSYKL